MSKSRAIALNTIIQIGGKIISTFLGLVAIGILTRYLGVEQFGWYTTAITFLQFAGILIDFGLIPVSAQMLGSGQYPANVLFRNLLGYRFATAAVFFSIVPLIAWFFPYHLEIKWAISLLSVSFLAIAMNQVLTGYYQKNLTMHIPVLGEFVGRLILVTGLLLGQYYQVNFLTLMGVVTAASLAYTTVLWLSAAKRETARLACDLRIWRAITITMWPVAISVIFNVIYLKGDTVLLSLYRSQSEVGLYGAAYRVVDILAQMAMLLMGVLLPLMSASFASKKITEFKQYYQNSFDSLMFLAVPIVVSTFILADKIMVFVAGSDFVLAGTMLRVLSLAIGGVYLGAVFGHTAVALGQQKATMWIYISDAIITFAGYAYAIPRFGWLGAAVLTVFSELYAGILLALVIRRYAPAKLSLWKFGKIVGAAGLMGIFLYFVSNIPLLLSIIGGGLIYFFSIISLGVYSWRELKQLTAK